MLTRRVCLIKLRSGKIFINKGGGGSRTHEITVLQTVALGHLATPPVKQNSILQKFISFNTLFEDFNTGST